MSGSDITSESRDVSGFRRVVLAGIGTLHIAQGEAETLTIEASADLMPKITAVVENGTLILGIRKGAWLKGLKESDKTARFNLTMIEMEGVTLAGAGDIASGGIRADELALTVSGAGRLDIRGLAAQSLTVLLSGAGDCEISGEVDSQEVKITGAGSYEARSLKSKTAKAVVSGTGNVVVSVDDTLDAQVSGLGSVRYYGEPTVFRRVTGIGSVEFAR
jgi:hypothetical protein